jgi:hypothetical protein
MKRAPADASGERRARAFWREELALLGVLLAFFSGVVVLAVGLPFDARLFPMVIGSAGVLLVAAIGIEQWRGARAGESDPHDAAVEAGRTRLLAALACAPAFGLLLWLLGFVAASLAAMLILPLLMGYRDGRRLIVIAAVTVTVLAIAAPHALQVDLPRGLVGEWLLDRLAAG